MADEEGGEIEWTGVARVDPAAVFVVGEVAVTAAELARWAREHRVRETESDWTRAWWRDVLFCALYAGSLLAVVWVVK